MPILFIKVCNLLEQFAKTHSIDYDGWEFLSVTIISMKGDSLPNLLWYLYHKEVFLLYHNDKWNLMKGFMVTKVSTSDN